MRGLLTQYQDLHEPLMECHDHNLRDIWAKDLLNVGGDDGEGGHMEGVLDGPLMQHQNLCEPPMQCHNCDLQNVWAKDLPDVKGMIVREDMWRACSTKWKGMVAMISQRDLPVRDREGVSW